MALKISQGAAIDKGKKKLVIRIIQFLSIFCDWGRMNLFYLHSINPTSTSTSTSTSTHIKSQFQTVDGAPELKVIEILKASGELLRGENRVRSSLRVTIADMKSFLSKLFKNNPVNEENIFSVSERPALGCTLSVPLPEYIELRGYIPLIGYEVLFYFIYLL